MIKSVGRIELPQLVTSADGRRAVLLTEFEANPFAPALFDGVAGNAYVQVAPRREPVIILFRLSGSFRATWDIPNQRLRWQESFNDAAPALSLIALATFLDENTIDENPAEGNYAAQVFVGSDLYEVFRRRPATDEELASYVRGRIYWTRKFNIEPAVFQPWEAQRFNVDVHDFDQAAFEDSGRLWERRGANQFYALPALIREVESVKVVAPSGSPQYDVALSFAGEQREYVERVAESLRSAGASVFYDGFADLWGKDLPVEFERVYRSGSRYVIIFVSREYLAKAWTNVERQHALAGRIERQDDSVLPARFDAIDLPGLPPTVGYRDIGNTSPEELAAHVLAKL